MNHSTKVALVLRGRILEGNRIWGTEDKGLVSCSPYRDAEDNQDWFVAHFAKVSEAGFEGHPGPGVWKRENTLVATITWDGDQWILDLPGKFDLLAREIKFPKSELDKLRESLDLGPVFSIGGTPKRNRGCSDTQVPRYMRKFFPQM